VRELGFESGQRVAKGDLLLQLDDQVDRAELDSLKADRRLAEIEFERVARLVKKKVVSQSDYDEARATLDSATAKVASQRARMGKKAIRAPFAGLLGIRRVDLGQYLAPGAEIVSLQALDPIYVDYTLPERHLSRLAVGQSVQLGVQAYPEREFAGRISAISARIEEGTRAIRIRATLANREQLLRPGMFARVQTLLPERQDVLTLPERAITYNPYGDSVFVIEAHGDEQAGGTEQVLRQQFVRLGRAYGDFVDVTDGLQAGDTVVTSGVFKLSSGMKVVIDNTLAPEPSLKPAPSDS